MARLLLQTRMAVIPIGARLPHWKLVYERFMRLDAWKADARHTIHLERQEQTMPVD